MRGMDVRWYEAEQVTVYSHLANYGGWWCADEITEGTDMDLVDVRRVLGELEDDGWVVRQYRGADIEWKVAS